MRLGDCREGEPGDRARRKVRELEEALDCAFLTPDHVWVLKAMLRRIDQLTADIAEVTARITRQCRPWQDKIDRLCTIPGFSAVTAQDLTAHPVRDVRAADGEAEVGEEVHRPRRDRNLPARGHTGSDQGRGHRIEVAWRPGHTVTIGRSFRALTTEPDLLPRLLEAGDGLPPEERATVLRRTG